MSKGIFLSKDGNLHLRPYMRVILRLLYLVMVIVITDFRHKEEVYY